MERSQVPEPPTMVAYGTTGSGYSGSATSRERQEREDGLGKTAYRQREALQAITVAGREGMTVSEIEARYGWHHGQSSSALTHLHRAEHVVRLTERRNGQEIYVLPELAGDREQARYNPRNRIIRHPRDYSDDAVREAMQIACIQDMGENFACMRKFLDALPDGRQ